MFPAPRARAHPDVGSGTRDASALKAAEHEAPTDDSGAVASMTREVSDAVWEGAALIALDYANTDGRPPVATEHVQDRIANELPKSPGAVASIDQVLREDLLTNDSLGG
jgi:hypothetical protein